MADEARASRSGPKRPPHNFVIAWKDHEEGPVLGYAIAELVVYFPAAVKYEAVAVEQEARLHEGRNAADPAFADLFAHPLEKRVILKAVGLPHGVVADPKFRVEMAAMSGDNSNLDLG